MEIEKTLLENETTQSCLGAVKMIIVKTEKGEFKYTKWQWKLAWFLTWLFGVLFGITCF